jgi:hypothetical protein
MGAVKIDASDPQVAEDVEPDGRSCGLMVEARITFRVTDGVIQVRYAAYGDFDDQFGHLYYDRPFSCNARATNYRKYFVNRDSGRCQYG